MLLFLVCSKGIAVERRNQTLNAINYISVNNLPAYVTTPHQTVIVPRINKRNETVAITILNISITESNDMEIAVEAPANKNECTVIDPYYGEEKVKISQNGKFTIRVGNLSPWRVKSIIFD